jgi:hypothetical protein
VPVGVAAFFLAPRLLDESRDTSVIAAVGIVAALTLIRRDELEQAPEQLEPVLDLAA